MHKYDGEFGSVTGGIVSERAATDEHSNQSDESVPRGGSTASSSGNRVDGKGAVLAKRSHHKRKPDVATGAVAKNSAIGQSNGME